MVLGFVYSALLTVFSNSVVNANAQFSSGAITNSGALAAHGIPAGTDTVMGISPQLCTNVELFSYLNGASSPLLPFGPAFGGTLAFSMTSAQAASFVSTYSSATAVRTLAGCASTYVAGSGAPPACLTALAPQTYGTLTGPSGTLCDAGTSTGCFVLTLAYAAYLTSFLPEQFFVGCNLVGSLRPDGTGSLNGGLFTARNVSDFLYGYKDDPIVPFAATIPGGAALAAGYPGLIGSSFASISELTAAFANGGANPADYSYVFNSGSVGYDQTGTIDTYEGVQQYQPHDAGYAGWGNGGKLNATFAFAGLSDLSQQPPRQRAFPDVVNSDGVYPPHVPPDFGRVISLYLSSARREVQLTLACIVDGGAPGCDGWHYVKSIATKRFTPAPSLGQLTVDGVPNEACKGTVSQNYYQRSLALGLPAALAGTPSTCDYGLRFENIFDLSVARGVPLALSLPFLGRADAALRASLSITHGGNERYFSQPLDGTFLDVEPMSGRVFNGEERLQSNWVLERTMLNSLRYAPLFEQNNTYVWPFVYLERTTTLTDDQATKFKDRVYGSFVISLAVLAAAPLIGAWSIAGAYYCWRRRRSFAGLMEAGEEIPSKKMITELSPTV